MPEANEVMDSILDSCKQLLGIPKDHDIFDIDIITHINSTFFILQQIGLGPTNGFAITDSSSKWDEYMGPEVGLAVRSYMYIQVRLQFDPPATSFTIEALKEQAKEYVWRLNVHREGVVNS